MMVKIPCSINGLLLQPPASKNPEILFPQMTKADVLAPGTGGDHIADLHLLVGDHDAVDEEFYQVPFLREGSVHQSLLHTLTEVFYRGDEGGQFRLPIGAGLQPL